MTWPLHTVGEHTPVEHAADLLAKWRATALPVVDVNGYLIGIVSEADLLDEQTDGCDSAYSTVGSIMTRDVISMSLGTDIRKLTHWLMKLGLRVMPITDSYGRLVGLVTREDLVPREQRRLAGLDWIVGRLRRLFGPSQAGAYPPAPVVYPTQSRPTRRWPPGHILHAGDIMTTNPLSVRETCPVDEAMALLRKYHFTAVPVVDDENHLIGIVSGADLVHDPGDDIIIHPQKRHRSAPRIVSGVMTTEVVFRHPRSDARELSHWLHSTGRRVMPIVDDEYHLVGVVTRSDLMWVREELHPHSDSSVPMQPTEVRDREL